ncbi:hypothetical protein L6164_030872 [Bauhinia variegata]|uniref:Uncharacterized protein n=1 Tax=Bauhinia variegata TaxID=167791 RepID=A0ACB9LDQ4_BAUVA|nr:hypothetical protein L6164_030872 [Bauhinia variegata]
MEDKNSRANDVGLVSHYQLENGSSQFVFFDVEDGTVAALVKYSLSFFTENFVKILASCDGLLLLSGYKEDNSCYYVFNPLTRNSDMIPQPSIKGYIVRVGLAYDGCQYQVVLVESSSSSILEFQVFSSDTGKWRHQSSNLSCPASLPEFEFQELGVAPLYSNGAIHWEISGYLLVYKVQCSHCELHELPNLFEDWCWQSTMTYRRCLCESGGRVYYCYTDLDGFHVWCLVKDHEHNLSMLYSEAANDPKRFSWRLVHSMNHEIFILRHQSFFGQFTDWEPYKIAPFAYSDNKQTIYLQLPGIVASYNIDKEILASSVCTYTYPADDFNCCSFLPFAIKPEAEVELLANREMGLHLPLAQVEQLSFCVMLSPRDDSEL